MKEFYLANKTILQKLAFLVIFIGGIFLFVNFLFAYTAPFIVGFVVALILNPIVGFLNTNKWCRIPRSLSSLLLIIITILLLVFIGTSIVTRIISEAKSFSENIPAYIEEWNIFYEGLQVKYNDIAEFIPLSIRDFFSETSGVIISNITSSLTAGVGSGVGQGGINLVKSVPNILMIFILSIISAFFFIKDKDLIEFSVGKIIPDWFKRSFSNVKKGILAAIGGYLKAQLILMSISGIICVLGLTIIKYPYALLIGILIAFVDALPIFGSGAIFWPWALYNFLIGDYRNAAGLMITYAVVFLTRQFLEPKVLGSQIGVHPLLTLISIYVGLKIFGALGFLIGPLIMITTKIIMESNLVLPKTDV